MFSVYQKYSLRSELIGKRCVRSSLSVNAFLVNGYVCLSAGWFLFLSLLFFNFMIRPNGAPHCPHAVHGQCTLSTVVRVKIIMHPNNDEYYFVSPKSYLYFPLCRTDGAYVWSIRRGSKSKLTFSVIVVSLFSVWFQCSAFESADNAMG